MRGSHEEQGQRVERLFRHLKEKTIVFHRKMSARDNVQTIKSLKQYPKFIHNILLNHNDKGASGVLIQISLLKEN